MKPDILNEHKRVNSVKAELDLSGDGFQENGFVRADVKRYSYFGGSIEVLMPRPNERVGVPSNSYSEWLEINGNQDAKFDIGLVRQIQHNVFSETMNNSVTDMNWERLEGIVGDNLIELADRGLSNDEQGALNNLGYIAEQAKLVSPEEVQRMYGQMYLNSLMFISEVLYSEMIDRVISYAGSPVKVPFRGASLTAKPFIESRHNLIPIKFTRIPTIDVANEKSIKNFAVGLRASQPEYHGSIMNDLAGLKGEDVIILEACVTTGLTNTSDIAYMDAKGWTPRSMLVVAPVMSRAGVLNVFRSADYFGVDLKMLTMKVFPAIGNSWGSGEDAVQDGNGRSVIGDPPRIVGPHALLGELQRAEMAFCARHNLAMI